MPRPRFIEIDGKRYLWRDVQALRRAQAAGARAELQPPLFPLIEGSRPKAARRVIEFTEANSVGLCYTVSRG